MNHPYRYCQIQFLGDQNRVQFQRRRRLPPSLIHAVRLQMSCMHLTFEDSNRRRHHTFVTKHCLNVCVCVCMNPLSQKSNMEHFENFGWSCSGPGSNPYINKFNHCPPLPRLSSGFEDMASTSHNMSLQHWIQCRKGSAALYLALSKQAVDFLIFHPC